ncbi:E3 ubiquitin-protein ligase TRIM33 [Pectinophora gossypiella]|uniref:E3 ubiquitin-protein ligase TRIM33 n=1 Tax=Pectinophora gossypiella TaxID=13191 RepID=UPI00214DFD21|nr:E3 ubiquitin-protein ligase TRIM33 [Pectinophora gossypiella]
MESIGGEEIERALMDLGPLLGVSIKEEVPEEPPDAATASASNTSTNAGNVASATSPGTGAAAEGGADSLASPGAEARVPASAARCVLCGAALAQQDGTPKLMECLHSACEPCIKAKIEEKLAPSRDFLGAERMTITCPVCRLQCQPANMVDQRFVLEKLAIDNTGNNGSGGGEQQCNSCEDTEPATSYCVDCAEFICDNCVHAHQRLKITKDHTIKSKEEALAELQAAAAAGRQAHDMFCREHPQERLSLFCETCDRLTCRDCQLQHHRDHKYQFSTEMAHQARASIASLLSEVSYKRVLLGSAMKVIRDRQQLIADKKKALVHEITQCVVKLTNAINSRGKQLVLRLNEVCDSKLRTLGEKKDALEQLAAITDHCVDFVNHALDQGSDTAVLYSKRAVCAHLQRIKSRRADIPNPEIPVRISLALDKLPDLIRVLSTIGAIVVDGKVDGGGAGAQGPYHPPASPAGGAGGAAGPAGALLPVAHLQPHQPPQHSAVVALQHAAMHQSYVQSVSAGAAGAGAVAGYLGAGAGAGATGAGAGARARLHTPLRHPHVTSTTHPHHLHGMNEMNLRGLLNPGRGSRAPPPVHPAQAMQHAYQHMMGAYNNAYGGGGGPGGGPGGPSGRRSGGPRTPSPAPPHYPHHHTQQQQQQQLQQQQMLQHHQQHAPAKWHIPQQSLPNGVAGALEPAAGGGGAGLDFKITLSRQAPRQPSLVTSTNPKTPSPNLQGGGALVSELDAVCAQSVQDLMATIAKLDSNGVQVVAEPPPPPPPLAAEPAASPAPHVHSSTDTPAAEVMATTTGGGASDPNEDWCAVCMDGGELMCCDKCPKVFHQYCHIPTIEKLPDETETWQCLLCVNFAELGPEPAEETSGGGLSARQQKLVERITLELYCQYEASLPFREPVPKDNLHYHAKVARPMCLDMIRMKLQPRAPQRYSHVAHFVADCRLMFRNAYLYNPPESQIYKDAKRLEEFLDAQLAKWLPEYAYWSGEGEPPTKRARLD